MDLKFGCSILLQCRGVASAGGCRRSVPQLGQPFSPAISISLLDHHSADFAVHDRLGVDAVDEVSSAFRSTRFFGRVAARHRTPR